MEVGDCVPCHDCGVCRGVDHLDSAGIPVFRTRGAAPNAAAHRPVIVFPADMDFDGSDREDTAAAARERMIHRMHDDSRAPLKSPAADPVSVVVAGEGLAAAARRRMIERMRAGKN